MLMQFWCKNIIWLNIICKNDAIISILYEHYRSHFPNLKLTEDNIRLSLHLYDIFTSSFKFTKPIIIIFILDCISNVKKYLIFVALHPAYKKEIIFYTKRQNSFRFAFLGAKNLNKMMLSTIHTLIWLKIICIIKML